MRRNKKISLVRVYIISICILRTLVLVIAGIKGFSIYFPRNNTDYKLVLSIVVLIGFWLSAIFYQFRKLSFLWIVFLLDGFMSYFCGMSIYRKYGTMNIYEAIYCGNIFFIIIDILLIAYLVNQTYKKSRRRTYLR